MNPRKQIVATASVPAPVGGLNARDSIAAMPETDAIVMRDFYPQPYGCAVRKGYVEHTTGLNGNVGSMMRYSALSGNFVIYAVDDDAVYDVTAPGVLDTLAQKIIDSTSSIWWYTNVSNSGGNHLVAFNGVDQGLWYDGTTYRRLLAGNGVDIGTWSNIDPVELTQCVVHQSRLWAVERASTNAWYLPPDQVYGVATSFDFGGVYNRGGYLQALETYTVDTGYGPNDYLAAISSGGEVALYQGTDPSDPTAWGLVGVFYVGPTFTRDCSTKFGGDFVMLTQYGALTMNSILKPAADSVLQNAISAKIQNLIVELISAGFDREGWSIHTYTSANMLLINVPGLVPSQTVQLAMNTLTNGWTVFTTMEATCWLSYNELLFYGSDGKVFRAWEGTLDNVLLGGTGGVPINAEAQQAFSYMGRMGVNKHFKLFRPTISYRGEFTLRAAANMEYDLDSTPSPASFAASIYGVWDQSLWSVVDVWAGGAQTDKRWISIVGLGYSAAIRISIDATTDVTWVATDWVYEPGGIV